MKQRWAAKRDTAEAAIIAELERIGAQVYALDYPCDLAVRFRRTWFLLEVKTGRGRNLTVSKDPRQQAQIEFLQATETPIVRTPLEALRAIGAIA